MFPFTLTEVSYYLRKYAPLVVLGCIILLIFFAGMFLLIISIPKRQVPVGPAPTPIFGLLPRPQTARQSTSSATFTYELDTLEGVPVTATSSATIFFRPQAPATFGGRDKAALMAKTAGFDLETASTKIGTDSATYSDDKKRLIVDLKDFNYSFIQDLAANPELLTGSELPTEEKKIIQDAKDTLASFTRYPESLARGTQQITYLRYDPTARKLEPVTKPTDANLVEVDFFPPDIEGRPVVTDQYFTSPHVVVLAYPGGEKDVVKSQVQYYEISREQKATYSLITGDEAFAKLQNGEALIIHDSIIPGQSIKIKRMLFAYYDESTHAPYLQPVYVFIGEGDFVAYVPAIADAWLQR